MNNPDDTFFPNIEQTVQALVKEMQAAREELREIGGKVSRMERRLYHAFPNVAEVKPLKLRKSGLKPSEQPTMSPDEVLRLYNDIVDLARAGSEDTVNERIMVVDELNLRLLVRELGVSLGKKKPSRKTLTAAILNRIKESVLLDRHTNRVPEEKNNDVKTGENHSS